MGLKVKESPRFRTVDKELVGYLCFGESAQVPIGKTLNSYDDKSFIDIGLGLQPELCGKGYGFDFTTCGLRCAKNMLSAKHKALCVIALFLKDWRIHDIYIDIWRNQLRDNRYRKSIINDSWYSIFL
jgi:hypothetical protein